MLDPNLLSLAKKALKLLERIAVALEKIAGDKE